MIRRFVLIFLVFLIILPACGGVVTKKPLVARPDSDDPYVRFLQADLLALGGDTGKSTSELRKLIKKDPENAFFYFMISQNFAREKNIKDAIAACEEAIRLSPKFSDARFFLAKLYSVSEQSVDSVRELGVVIKDDPKNEDAYILLSRERIVMREYWAAIDALRDLLKVNPDSAMAYFLMGQIYQQNLMNPKKAAEAYDEALAIEPLNVSILTEAAELDLKEKRTKRALQRYQEIGKIETSDVAVQLKIALVHFEMKEYQEAIDIFQHILTDNPDADKIRYYLGILYDTIGKRELALGELEKVPSSSGFYRDARLKMVGICRILERNEDAIKYLQEGIKEKNKISEFYQILAVMLEEKGSLRESIDVLKKGHDEIPADEQIAFFLAIMYEKTDETDLAISAMKDVLKINPENANALNFIGYAYAEKGENLEEALDLVQRALILKPKNGFVTDSLGWVYYKKGDYETSLKYLTKANELQPNEVTVLHHMADVYAALENVPLAKKYYKRALDAALKVKIQDKDEIAELKAKLEELK